MNAGEITNCLTTAFPFSDVANALQTLHKEYPMIPEKQVADMVEKALGNTAYTYGYLYFSDMSTLHFLSQGQWRKIHNHFVSIRRGDLIAKAAEIAARDHGMARDRGGRPYILHALRVGMAMDAQGASEETIAAGIMHDVPEDTPTKIPTLRGVGFPETVLNGVDSVTKRDGETLEEKAQRICSNPMGRQIKKADLKDNMDITRLKNRASLTEKDLRRVSEYAWLFDRIVGGHIGN